MNNYFVMQICFVFYKFILQCMQIGKIKVKFVHVMMIIEEAFA